MHKIRTFLRRLLLLHDKSDQPTSLLPLGRIHSVAVLRDAEDGSTLDGDILRYFTRKGIAVRLMSRRDTKLRSKEELFISLVPDADVNEQYAAVASHAKFKVGTHQIKDSVFDLVVCRAKEGDARQIAVFRAITELLEKIQ